MAIEARHSRSCPRRTSKARCSKAGCSYRAVVGRGSDRRTKSFPSEAEARAWEVSTKAGGKLVKSAPTLDEYMAHLFEGMREGSVLSRHREKFKLRSIQKYEADYRNHLKKALGTKKLDAVRRQDVQALVDTLMVTLSPKTIDTVLNCLQIAYRRALRDGVIQNVANPTQDLELPKVVDAEMRIAPPSEIDRLLDPLPLNWRLLYAFAIYSGMRAGEIAALRWTDILWERKLIDVKRGYDQTNHLYLTPKGGEARQTILMPSLEKILRQWKDERNGHAGDLIFPRENSIIPVGLQTVRDHAAEVWTEKKVYLDGWETPGIGLHECRHTFVSLCLKAGLDLKSVSVFCGHKSYAFTFKKYGHLVPDSHFDYIDRFEAYLTQNGSTAPQAIDQAS